MASAAVKQQPKVSKAEFDDKEKEKDVRTSNIVAARGLLLVSK